MKYFILTLITGLILVTGLPASRAAQDEDMRVMAVKAREKQLLLLEKTRKEKILAEQEAEKSRKEILEDRDKLLGAISRMKAANKKLTSQNKSLGEDIVILTQKEKKLNDKVTEMDAEVKELVGFVRITAKDLSDLTARSLQSAVSGNSPEIMDRIVDNTGFPGMKEISTMTDLLFDEIRNSGQVRIQPGTIIDRSGREVTADILSLGNFSAAYKKEGEIGFLLHSDQSRRLFALSKKPPGTMQKEISRYMAGESISVPIDMSKGAAMRQLTHKLSLLEQIPKGGPVVWPIVGIAVVALLIILERIIFLSLISMNHQNFMEKLKNFIEKNEWQACKNFCKIHNKKPLARAVMAAVPFRDKSRIDMENALQEAILREIPPMERFMSTLGMLAAIAPLMGLLGTVTGMINTFHVITFFGTSDPRMMSGGISEALITTMLGLSVAIPIMLCHTLINRKVENLISTMEEKAVSFVNTVFITRTRKC